MSRSREPATPYVATRPGSALSLSSRTDGYGPVSVPATPASLSVNFLPNKFAPVVGIKKRRGKRSDIRVPKQGGGRDAFRPGEARMAEADDEDYDGVQGGWFEKSDGRKRSKMKWNRFKWTLFVANLVLGVYSMVAFIFCLLTWFNVWSHADIIRVGNRGELIISTIAACLGIITSLVGWAGILLNNRSFLAVFTFMLWICFALLVAPGYMTYRRRTYNLEGKINAQWSRDLGSEGRARVQDELHCCGYYSPYVEATVTQTCYSRSILPGCKSPYLHFERKVLKRWYTASFGIVPFHIAIMVAGLLCSNHITYRFGKGMTPKAYRLSLNSMAVIMDKYASQLAEQYGADLASEIIARSRSDLHLSQQAPQMSYNDGSRRSSSSRHDGYGRSDSSRHDGYGRSDSSSRHEGYGRPDSSNRYDTYGRPDSSSRYDPYGRPDSGSRHDAYGRPDSSSRHDAYGRSDSSSRHDGYGRSDSSGRYYSSGRYNSGGRYDGIPR